MYKQNQKIPNRNMQSIFKVSILTFAIQCVSSSGLFIIPIRYAVAEDIRVQQYQISAGSLSTVLNQFVAKSGTTIAVDSKKLHGLNSKGLQGSYTIESAFQEILANSGFSAVKAGQGYVLVQNTITQPQNDKSNKTAQEYVNVELSVITSQAEKDRDTKGYDDVYDKNYSTVYAGKDYIERFKGTTPSDLLKGMANVYSGDARNSGAIDPNIRGVQGQGRVPVTIDGTEQAITVWRGYNGVNNRNYIDPNLLSSIQVVKGSQLDSDVKTGVGGGVAARTLEVDDIVKPNKKYGIELKMEGGNNTTKERIPTSYTGQDYRDVFDSLGVNYGTYNAYVDPLSISKMKNSGENKWYNLQDQAIRLAVATKQEKFDLLAAYAYRSRGNYFAGKKGQGFYTKPEGYTVKAYNFNFVPYIANVYVPNGEVANTSNEMESYLFKGTWRPTENQALQFTYRDSTTTYGEIMPSRISWWSSSIGDGYLPQWPLSKVRSKAYNLEYKWNPDESKWINIKANIWQTDTFSKTYTSGGFINFIAKSDAIYNRNVDTNGDGIRDRNSTIAFSPLYNTAYTEAKNTRKGVTITNKMELLDNLTLTIGGDIQKEQLKNQVQNISNGTDSTYQMLPRAGRRQENQYFFNFDFQPFTWLDISAGAKTVSYWSFDDYLNEHISTSSSLGKVTVPRYAINVVYSGNYTQDEYETDTATLRASIKDLENKLASGILDSSDIVWANNLIEAFQSQLATYSAKIGTTVSKSATYYWEADANGKFLAANNPLLNGTVSSVIDESSITSTSMTVSNLYVTKDKVEKKKDHSRWAPSVTAAIKFNPNNRLYLSYNEAYRMPSLFETTLGFSASQSIYGLKPEHAHNIEIAYIYSLKDLLNMSGQADIKLAYFNNKTTDVVERSASLLFSNVDEQKISGYELSGRYDNGKIFSDLSLVYNKKNEVCDESSALISAYNNGGLSAVESLSSYCTKYGFNSGYLVNMALPKWQANLNLGMRFLDNKIELGTRTTYFKKYINPYANTTYSTSGTYYNQPISWSSTIIFDAYANYKYNDWLTFDLTGTNLTNRYYIDPLTRSAVPAPGRTIKIGLTAKF